jgi:hypothetical protein
MQLRAGRTSKAAEVREAPRVPAALQHVHSQQLRSIRNVCASLHQSTDLVTADAADVSRRQLLAAATAAAAVAVSAVAAAPAHADDFTRTASGLLYLDVREGKHSVMLKNLQVIAYQLIGVPTHC